MLEQILSERITQLDNLYSISKDLRFKSLILSQMVMLAKRIDENMFDGLRFKFTEKRPKPETIEETDIDQIIKQLIRMCHINSKLYFETDDSWSLNTVTKNIGFLAVYMDQIRAKILVELIERGLIKSFKEIPIGIKELEKEGYGVGFE